MALLPPREARLSPLMLFLGPEDFLYRKALPSLRAAMRERDPEVSITVLDASSYEAGTLFSATQASLFSASSLVEVSSLASMTDDFLADVLAYLEAPSEDSVLVMHHGGGVRGKKLLDRLKKEADVYDCSTPKKDAEKQNYVVKEFAAARRKISSTAVSALVSAVGSSLSELDAACRQLLQDTEGAVDEKIVDTYYGGRVEATAFAVADAAVTGHTVKALGIARSAMITGTDPVPLVASIAIKLRQIARVAGFEGSSAEAAKEFAMPPWQVKNAMMDARRWDKERLTHAVAAAAEADHRVKGGGRNPGFAVERLIIELGRLASSRR